MFFIALHSFLMSHEESSVKYVMLLVLFILTMNMLKANFLPCSVTSNNILVKLYFIFEPSQDIIYAYIYVFFHVQSSVRSFNKLKELEFVKGCNFLGFVICCRVEFNSYYLPVQGPRPGFFPDDKSQKKGAGLLYLVYVYFGSDGGFLM